MTHIPSTAPLYSQRERLQRASSSSLSPSPSLHGSPTSRQSPGSARQPPHIASRTPSTSTLRPSASRPPSSPSSSTPFSPSHPSTSTSSLPDFATVTQPSKGKARASIRRVFSSLGLRKVAKQDKVSPVVECGCEDSEDGNWPTSRRLPAAHLRRSGLRDWAEYNAAYAEGTIDIQNPPLPPSSSSSLPLLADLPQTPNAYDSRLYEAPYPANEADRQRAVARLDLFGRRARARKAPTLRSPLSTPFSMSPSSSVSSLSPSNLSSSARDSYFSHRSSISTVATSLSVAPSSASSMKDHPGLWAIVGQAKELFGARFAMVSILDGEKQRFLATAGMPDRVEGLSRTGSICAHTILNGGRELVVLDTETDWRFAHADLSVALGVRFYIGVPMYAPATMDAVGPRVPIGTLSVADDRRRRNGPSDDLRDQLFQFAEQASKEIAHWVAERDEATPDPVGSHIFDGLPPLPLPTFLPPVEQRLLRALDPDLQTILDMAMQILCETLDLSLAYLVALDFPDPLSPTPSPPTIRLISSHNLPNPLPTFDATLHAKALRSAAGGLRYQNGSAGADGFSAGMLVAVLEVRQTGYVLGGFASRGREEIGRAEMAHCVQFAAQLETFVARL